MKNDLKKTIDGIDSINNELYDEMYVAELEKRLETDPLLVNGLLSLFSQNSMTDQDLDPYIVCKGGTY